MTLNQYTKDKTLSPTTLLLIDKLKLFWENDEEFVIGVLVDLETDFERQQVIDYIDKGKDVTYENIILFALELEQSRNQNNQ
jgi:hypothetical protein